ncbi:MAG: T9SS type A sorting domain-containing protein, partial [Bacteroidetes bacterium]|nr:T9SS type A sorting domain-containing protein [Bacteroidota bacterium]
FLVVSEGQTASPVAADDAPAVPGAFVLSQNYPNPFTLSTTIRYRVPRTASVTLTVHDVLGRTVATLVDGQQAPGEHVAAFEAAALPNGVYLYRLQAEGRVINKTMIHLK